MTNKRQSHIMSYIHDSGGGLQLNVFIAEMRKCKAMAHFWDDPTTEVQFEANQNLFRYVVNTTSGSFTFKVTWEATWNAAYSFSPSCVDLYGMTLHINIGFLESINSGSGIFMNICTRPAQAYSYSPTPLHSRLHLRSTTTSPFG